MHSVLNPGCMCWKRNGSFPDMGQRHKNDDNRYQKEELKHQRRRIAVVFLFRFGYNLLRKLQAITVAHLPKSLLLHLQLCSASSHTYARQVSMTRICFMFSPTTKECHKPASSPTHHSIVTESQENREQSNGQACPLFSLELYQSSIS